MTKYMNIHVQEYPCTSAFVLHHIYTLEFSIQFKLKVHGKGRKFPKEENHVKILEVTKGLFYMLFYNPNANLHSEVFGVVLIVSLRLKQHGADGHYGPVKTDQPLVSVHNWWPSCTGGHWSVRGQTLTPPGLARPHYHSRSQAKCIQLI